MDHPLNHNSNERLQKQIKMADNSHHELGRTGFDYECSDYRVSQ